MKRLATFYHVLRYCKNWWVYILDYLKLFPQNKLLYLKLRSGQNIYFRARTPDRGTINEIFFLRIYNPGPAFKINKDDLVVDVGAHIGVFSVFASRYQPRIITFEPQKDNFEILQKNLGENKINPAKMCRAAVCLRGNKRKLFLSEHNDSHNLFIESDKFEEVECVNLNQFLLNEPEVSFLKLDCEGCEYEVLENFPLEKVKKIVFEVHPQKVESGVERTEKLLKFLEAGGFDVSKKNYLVYAKR